METTENQQIESHGSLERLDSKGDDPWCLICGVNLALDGRTYTIVSRHNNELCDIFSRVLGAEFNQDYASVNVCNRCERQLRRLGRYSSIIIARREGEKLREQLEKNLAKYGQKVVECGHFENLPSPTSSATEAKPAQSNTVSNLFGTSFSYEGHSSFRKGGKYSSRSVSGVHFVDDREAQRRELSVRKYSAPEGVRRRESLSPFSEGERRREARRRKWSSASSTSEETTRASTNNSADYTLFPRGRGVAFTFPALSDADRCSEDSISSDLQQTSEQLITENSSVPQESTLRPEEPDPLNISPMEEETAISTDQSALVEKSESFDQSAEDDKLKKDRLSSLGCVSSESATDSIRNQSITSEEAKENADLPINQLTKTEEQQCPGVENNSQAVWAERMNPFDNEKQTVMIVNNVDNGENADDDVFVAGVDTAETLPRMDTIQADDELFTKLGSELLKDSAQDSESPNEAEPDPSDFSADNRSNLSEVEDRITTKTQFKGAYYNIGSTEDLLQEFANEEIREKARWSKLTYTESVDVGEAGDDVNNFRPMRPPRRSRSSRSSDKSQRRKGGKSQVTSEQEAGDKENGVPETREHDGTTDTDKEAKVNGVVLDKINESSVTVDTGNGDGKVKFDKDAPEGIDSQAVQEGGSTTNKSEKSPLIGKDGKSSDLRLKNGHESKLKDQFPGFLCCSIL